MNGRAAAIVVAVAATLVLTACTGVPSASAPEVVVNQIGAAAQSPQLAITPPANADPRTIVNDFLAASATDDAHHTAARGFLTPEAHTRWSDTTMTVVDSYKVSNFVKGTVTLTGRELGTVSASGIYTPVILGDGSGGLPVPFSFVMKQVAGQWRIDTLQNGVILDSDTFQRLYEQHSLYFYDLAEQHLVPDPRYSPLVDPALLSNWLISQLAAGPRPELQNAVTTELPAQIDPRRVTVQVGAVSVVQIPGASQLDPETLTRLAAQIAITLSPVSQITDITIEDGARQITIPQGIGPRFSADDFPDAATPAIAAPSLYYIDRDGGVVDQAGHRLGGAVGSGADQFTSAALATGASDDLRVAGVTGIGANARLLVGTLSAGVHQTTVRGHLSRPAWVPQRDEVWIGDGANVLRVGLSGKPAVVTLTATSGAVSGSVTALRFSPEGARIAIVFTSAAGIGQVWVGAVVRNGAQVRVDSLEPVTPTGIAIKDVAWNDPLKLFVIGHSVATTDANLYEVQVDGSRWTPRNITNLPQDPDSITVAENQVAWVSAGPTVWVQSSGAWASPELGSVSGTNPIYLE